MRAVRFTPLGPLTFRKPGYFGVGSIADSYRLPTLSMLEGTLRTAIGNAHGVDWKAYASGKGRAEWYELLGKPSQAPPFVVSHPFLVVGSRWFFRAPFNVIVAEDSAGGHEAVALPFEMQIEHIPVRLPRLVSFDGRKAVDGDVYLSYEAMRRLWEDAGRWTAVVKGRDFILLEDAISTVWHTGIKVSRQRLTVDRGEKGGKGFMYRYMVVEFMGGVEIGVLVDGADDAVDSIDGAVATLGAKGGSVEVHVSGEIPLDVNLSGAELWVLYSGVKASDPPWDELFDTKPDGAALQGAYIHTGFDMAKRDGKPTTLYLPPASTFYFAGGCGGAKRGIFITM